MQNNYNANNMYEWNIDGCSEYNILSKLQQITMVATAYRTAHNCSDQLTTHILIARFTGQLKGCSKGFCSIFKEFGRDKFLLDAIEEVLGLAKNRIIKVKIPSLYAAQVSFLQQKSIATAQLAKSGIIPLHHTFKWYHATNLANHESEKSSTYHVEDMEIKIMDDETCDISTGEWIPNPDGPYYTNTTCWAIHEHQNCMKYGRPDTGFLKWRWKPKECELPIFNPYQFLDMMRNKSLAFVGDSVGRNQMQSLMCLLSRVPFSS
ncbi:Protein trichome birefringence-like 19 [Capsicum annuum]|nr:Protein trichome birefringence-like 19 [Capsicum annuum]KAF3666159.1 Protein trichome birefringence-like 19 [Capsicum annuum]